MRQISATELQAWLAAAAAGERAAPQLLDVREPWEFTLCHIPGSLSVPMHAVPARLAEWERTAETVVICHHGARSFQVALFLERQGHDKISNLQGGVSAWARDADPAMPTY